jgi:hypothetical protein
MQFVGYWGDWVKVADDKYRTDIRSERLTLTGSPTSNYVRGQVVEGKNRFAIVGTRARSPDGQRDELSLSFIGEPKVEDHRTEAQRNASAPTSGTYVLKKGKDNSYTGVAVYWDKCNKVWVQCPYALERGENPADDPPTYAKDRWPTRFNLDELENQCRPVMKKPVDQTIADRGQDNSKDCS